MPHSVEPNARRPAPPRPPRSPPPSSNALIWVPYPIFALNQTLTTPAQNAGALVTVFERVAREGSGRRSGQDKILAAVEVVIEPEDEMSEEHLEKIRSRLERDFQNREMTRGFYGNRDIITQTYPVNPWVPSHVHYHLDISPLQFPVFLPTVLWKHADKIPVVTAANELDIPAEKPSLALVAGLITYADELSKPGTLQNHDRRFRAALCLTVADWDQAVALLLKESTYKTTVDKLVKGLTGAEAKWAGGRHFDCSVPRAAVDPAHLNDAIAIAVEAYEDAFTEVRVLLKGGTSQQAPRSSERSLAESFMPQARRRTVLGGVGVLRSI
ncbi:hypothetical protein JCM11641_003615 [Rhodosporidiobolus odoratus]